MQALSTLPNGKLNAGNRLMIKGKFWAWKINTGKLFIFKKFKARSLQEKWKGGYWTMKDVLTWIMYKGTYESRFLLLFFWEEKTVLYLRLTAIFSIFSLLSAGIIGMCHHTQLQSSLCISGNKSVDRIFRTQIRQIWIETKIINKVPLHIHISSNNKEV